MIHRVNEIKHVYHTKASTAWKESFANLKENDISKMIFFSQIKVQYGYSEYLSKCLDFNSKLRTSVYNIPVDIYPYAKMGYQVRLFVVGEQEMRFII